MDDKEAIKAAAFVLLWVARSLIWLLLRNLLYGLFNVQFRDHGNLYCFQFHGDLTADKVNKGEEQVVRSLIDPLRLLLSAPVEGDTRTKCPFMGWNGTSK